MCTRLTLCSICILTSSALSLLGDPITLYVSPGGNDHWSGRLQSPAPAGNDGPKATVAAALASLRSMPTPRREGATILLRDGVYPLTEPLAITAEDSGADPEHPLLIAAFSNERPILSGGRRITGWKPVAGKPDRWQTEIPEVRNGQWYFHQLFVSGQRRQRARTPNEGFFRIQGASSQEKPFRLKFKPGEIQPAWASDGDVEVVAYLAWSDIRMQIRAVDQDAGIATLSGEPRPSNREDNARYIVENAPDGLDTAGEWYLNRRTGVLEYQANPSEDLNQLDVIAPKLDQLVTLRGDRPGRRPVQHVVLRGLTFSHTDWSLGEHGYADTQAAIATPGDVAAEAAVYCTIEDCTFAHLAGYALEIGRGCRGNRIVGNELFDLGGGGIRIGETAVPQDAFDRNSGHIITDNHIHALGRVYSPAVGVLVLQSGGNRVAHNHIHDLYYTAVSVGWNWGYEATPCRDNVVEFNHMHDIGQSMLSDMGAVYTLGIQKGTVIRNNLIHDVNSFTYGGWGLYPDEGSTDIVWENNVVYRTKSAGFHQHYGRENVVRNNIFAFGKEHQLMRTREESHLSFYFVHNIVYFDSGSLLGSNWKNDRFVADFNLYYDTRPAAKPDAVQFSGASLEQWRQRGHDVHSAIADPLFVAPDQLDFRLKPESPALKLGFEPIDLSTVGIRSKSSRPRAGSGI